jgi:hypothetical protein
MGRRKALLIPTRRSPARWAAATRWATAGVVVVIVITIIIRIRRLG